MRMYTADLFCLEQNAHTILHGHLKSSEYTRDILAPIPYKWTLVVTDVWVLQYSL